MSLRSISPLYSTKVRSFHASASGIISARTISPVNTSFQRGLKMASASTMWWLGTVVLDGDGFGRNFHDFTEIEWSGGVGVITHGYELTLFEWGTINLIELLSVSVFLGLCGAVGE
jgi:hypothetical protein